MTIIREQNRPILFFVVDDDIDDRELFKEALLEVDRNIDCATAEHGEEALEILNSDFFKTNPDYIFLDLNMPRINGKQTLREIKKIPRYAEVPVIIYSTSSSKKDIEESIALGASRFYTKPSSFEELRQMLQKLVVLVRDGGADG